jgi:hypothetical protein
MAVFSNVPAVPAAGVTQAANRAAAGSRYTSADQIDNLSGSSFVGTSDQWRPANDQNFNQAGFGQYPHGRDPQLAMTPLVFRTASSFAASLSSQTADSRQSAPMFLIDLQHAVGIYEYNMKLTSGAFAGLGSVVNRYS